MSDILTHGEEMLFRQIHPSLLVDGEPASNRFVPSEDDKGRLSLDRSSLTSAAESHALYTSSGRQSAAVFGLLVGEFNAVPIPCLSDPTEEEPPHPANPAHALADYTGLDPKSLKNIAKRLKRLAIQHGQLHPPLVGHMSTGKQ